MESQPQNPEFRINLENFQSNDIVRYKVSDDNDKSFGTIYIPRT